MSVTAPDYSVPALDKALDILELLAEQSGALAQGEIAERVERSASQIFRVLQTLQTRGYIYRHPQSGLYSLSLRMFDLAHRHQGVRGLILAAQGPMRLLADQVRQSCNLGMLEAGRVLILAQVESPADFGFHVRVGATFPVDSTATGALLMAHQDDDVRGAWLASLPPDGARAKTSRFDTIRERGFERADDSIQPGITDLVYPIFGPDGRVSAALTVPYVSTSFSSGNLNDAEQHARSAAASITAALGGAAAG